MRALGYGVNLVMRLLTALAIPAWGLITFGLGLRYDSGWWIAMGASITLAGAILLIGSPLVRPFLYDS
ncbi:MAG TPA: hypothetical protein VMD75_02715 [Candidatus Binataceae bacterium]|nr:hypothetical protein [Candidatus Binataceae bacterium]